MKEGIHPKNYRKVVFKDMSNEHMFICQSTVDTKETIQYEDGNEYPLFKLDISYKSHPFFTGQSMFIDTAGRIDKFKKRYQKKAD
jgi:large subunit ribosomal protein L31